MDVYEYFDMREREYRSLSLTPDRSSSDMFAALDGSDGQRGRIFGALRLEIEADVFLSVSERVDVRGGYVERTEYAYYCIIEGAEAWGYDFDPSHPVPYHRHEGSGHARYPDEERSFKFVAERAWDEASRLVSLES